MECHEVRDRLVAWQDGELAPSETVQVEEHLDGCADCQRTERRLAAATPRPELLRPTLAQRVPASVLAALKDRVSVEVVLAEARRTPAPPPAVQTRMLAFLRRETRVPVGAVLAYALVLCAAIGFGLSGLWQAAPEPTTVIAGDTIPAGQFQPAAYDPGAGAPDRSGAPGRADHGATGASGNVDEGSDGIQ